jgi:hypothetical protein
VGALDPLQPPQALRGFWTVVESLMRAAAAFAFFIMELLKAGWLYGLALIAASRPTIA